MGERAEDGESGRAEARGEGARGGEATGGATGEMVDGARCPRCGTVTAPPEPFGCEGCGAPPEGLLPIDVHLVGTVKSFATVHRHHRPEPATPFTVVHVLLDDGPALKGLLDGGTVTIEDRVRGRIGDGVAHFEAVR